MSGRNQSSQAPQSPHIDLSLFDSDFDGNNGEFGYDVGSEYVNPEANIPSFTSNIDPALAKTNNFAPSTANPLQQFHAPQHNPQYAPPSSSNPADWPRPPNMCYHPAVGWYVPIGPSPAASVGYASPEFVGQPSAMINQLPVPVPVPAPMAPIVSPFQAAATVTAAPSASTGQKRKTRSKSSSRETSRARSQKRKYGPSAYLDEQASKRAKGDHSGPSLAHRESVNYGSSPASRGQTPEQKKAAREEKAARRPHKTSDVGLSTKKIGQLNAAIVQPCACPAARQAKANHVKRARNAFFVFRGDFSAKWRAPKGRGKGKGKQNDVANVSAAAGETWRAMSAAEKAPYELRAKQEAAEHKEAHPDYQYNPSKAIEARFGQPDCKCGAYQANVAEWQRAQGLEGLGTIEEDQEGEEEGDNIFVAQFTGPVTRSRSRSLPRSLSAQGGLAAPVVQMQLAPYFTNPATDFDQYDYGLGMTSTPIQMGFGDLLAPLQPDVEHHVSFEDSAFTPKQAHGQSPSLRRSPRQNSKSLHYDTAPLEVDNEFWDRMMAEDFTSAPKTLSPKRRPTPISTTRKASGLSTISELSDSDPRLVGMSTPSLDGPAARTRSKSITPKGTIFSHTSRRASTPPSSRKTSTPSTADAEGDFGSLFGSESSSRRSSGNGNGTPKSAASSKASPKTVKKPSLALPGLALPGQKVASGRITRSQSRGRSRKRS